MFFPSLFLFSTVANYYESALFFYSEVSYDDTHSAFMSDDFLYPFRERKGIKTKMFVHKIR